MLIGYARVSTDDQRTASQVAALKPGFPFWPQHGDSSPVEHAIEIFQAAGRRELLLSLAK